MLSYFQNWKISVTIVKSKVKVTRLNNCCMMPSKRSKQVCPSIILVPFTVSTVHGTISLHHATDKSWVVSYSLLLFSGITRLGQFYNRRSQYDKAETELKKAWRMIESAFLTKHKEAGKGKHTAILTSWMLGSKDAIHQETCCSSMHNMGLRMCNQPLLKANSDECASLDVMFSNPCFRFMVLIPLTA